MARQVHAGEGRRRVATPWRASPPSMPARSSACGGSAGGSAASMPCATSTSTSRPARGAPSSDPTARGRRRCSTSSRATCPRRRARSSSSARTSGTSPLPGRTRLGMGRTYQKSRLFLGLSVEDNLYLAVLGSRGGHLRLTRKRALDGEMRERARELARAVGLDTQIDSLVGSISHGEQRQLEVAMARATEPKLMLLDEPASGLSRGERVALTDLLLELEKSITLILIEHDMDVALRVAQSVTMMHDGRKIVEGTPDEIRANDLVHELYLGGRVTDDGIEVSRVTAGEPGQRRARGAGERRPAAAGRQEPQRPLRPRARAAGRQLRDGRQARRPHRAQRDGQDDALQRHHAHPPGPRDRLGRLRGARDRRAPVLQDRGRRDRLRAAGSATVRVTHGRRAPAHGGAAARQPPLDARRRLRAVPALGRAPPERRDAAVRRRAADARHRARAALEPQAADHGRALRGARADDHRDADRDLPPRWRRRASRSSSSSRTWPWPPRWPSASS